VAGGRLLLNVSDTFLINSSFWNYTNMTQSIVIDPVDFILQNSTLNGANINITADNVTVDAKSAINATGQGYLGGHSNSALNGEGLAQATGAKGGEPFHWRAETGTAPPSSPVAWAQAGALQAQTSTEATEEGP